MSLRAIIDGRANPIVIADYSVTQAINAYAPGDTSGGTSSITISAITDETGSLATRLLSNIDKHITLYDDQGIEDTPWKGRGIVSGVISAVTRTGRKVSFSVDSMLNRLNTDKIAQPFFGKSRPAFITSYIINEATNPSFETATTNLAVTAGTGGTAAVTNPTVTAFAGTKVGRATWSVAATGVGGLIYTHPGIIAGNAYTFSAYLRASALQNMQMGLAWLDASSVQIGSIVVGTDMPVDNSGFIRFSLVNLTAPAGAVTANLRFFNFNGTTPGQFHNWAVGNTLDIDGVMIVQGGALSDYGDGSSANGSWTGTANASSSQLSIQLPQDPGYDATLSNAFRYYASLVGIPTTSLNINSDFDNILVAFPYWKGNVLDHIKLLSSAYGVQFNIADEVINITTPRTRIIRVENQDRFSETVTSQRTAKTVVVKNYNNQWLTDSVAASATQVYSVDEGGSTNFYIDTTSSLGTVNNPLPSASVAPFPYIAGPGVYVVLDSNNNIVNPNTWSLNGGRVTTSLDPDKPNSIFVSVQAPRHMTEYVAPYRLASNVTGEDVPSLYITGTGVFTNVQDVIIYTGATESETPTDEAPTVDNIFISDVSQAHDRGLYSADDASGPTVTGNGSIAFDPDANGQEFGVVVGSRYRTNGSIMRMTQTNTSPSKISFDSVQDVAFNDLTDLFSILFSEFNITYAGLTFAAFDALWLSTFTFNDFNAQTSNPTFASFNTIYSGATFNDYSVYPLLREVPVDDTEARI